MSETIVDAAALSHDATMEADVVIVGTGAGGGFAAEVLTQAGLKVVMLEAGSYYRTETFSQNEAVAMPRLYQWAGAQRTKDGAIAVFQGRCVGGTTVVNYTSSFRTPPQTLKHWAEHYGVKDADEAALAPHFQAVEERLNIHEWTEVPPNQNNALLGRGCDQLGLEWRHMRRNVRGCANTGLCGLGCPIGAKQSMLVTTIPEALKNGATLVQHAQADTVTLVGGKASGITAYALDRHSVARTGRKLEVKARHVVLAAGSIRSPGILLRTKAPDPSGLTGKRTFLHPVNGTLAVMPEPVEGWRGAPQSTYTDAYNWPPDERMGFKIEVAPLQPMFALVNFDKSFGAGHAALVRRYPHMHVLVSLLRDGFHAQSAGGSVQLLEDGTEVLDYPFNDYLRAGARATLEAMMAIQFAAGAEYVLAWHADAKALRDMDAARKWLAEASFAGGAMMYGSAHVMGGCAMGADPKTSVVDSYGAHHQVEGLSVLDGSIFPTSIGANPQESIYAFALRNARRLAARLGAGSPAA